MIMRIRPVRSMRGSCCIDCAVFPLHPTTSGCALQQSVPKPETQQTLCGWRLLEPCFRQRTKKLASVVRVIWSSYPLPFWSACVFPSTPPPFRGPPSFTRDNDNAKKPCTNKNRRATRKIRDCVGIGGRGRNYCVRVQRA